METNDFMATMQPTTAKKNVSYSVQTGMNAKYVCPDCGQQMENNQKDCPNCGCPAAELLAKGPQSAEIVYYSDNAIRITNKLWSFGGWSETDDYVSSVMHFPTDNISSVSISKNWRGSIILIILAIILFVCVFANPRAPETMFLVIAAIALLIGAIFLAMKRYIVVKPFNSTLAYRYTVNSPKEAKKILNLMAKCLIENR
ncbi:MAG: hypothetical protein UHJ11_01130 [Paludibacteraceae bacterium]|nr:hypothetical protein [Paludibacteraceae bacterium]